MARELDFTEMKQESGFGIAADGAGFTGIPWVPYSYGICNDEAVENGNVNIDVAVSSEAEITPDNADFLLNTITGIGIPRPTPHGNVPSFTSRFGDREQKYARHVSMKCVCVVISCRGSNEKLKSSYEWLAQREEPIQPFEPE